jgi:flagellar basal-body rod modification protein FlgD
MTEVEMAVSAISGAQSAFGLDFQSLLKIILTQLTYQDPLKPMDNFQFVSQLGQFAQLQQSQTQSGLIEQLLAAESNNYAVGLIGKTVDLDQGSAQLSGTVQSVSMTSGQIGVVIRTADGKIINGVSLADISQIR